MLSSWEILTLFRITTIVNPKNMRYKYVTF